MGEGARGTADASPLVRMARERLAAAWLEGWSVRVDEIWCLLRPPGYVQREQGWKLHLSCTPASAAEVLDRALDVLLRAGCQFKFASTPERVRELTGGRYTRGGAGKFITVYPDDDDRFRCLARELHEATAGLAGPSILSDRPYRPGSLVHYRFGAFRGRQTLTNDGEYRYVIVAPGGELVEDRRDAWFEPPQWAESPFPEQISSDIAADGVLLANRFVVREAVRHANKGGVFHAMDRFTAEQVIVKQARAHVGGDADACAALRNEAELLDRLGRAGITPRRVALFEQDGDLFLVQERVDGPTLRSWCAEQAIGDEPGVPWPRLVDAARRLVTLIETVHRHGLVIRDLSPTNLLVRHDDSLTLIDLEFAAADGAAAIAVGTPGYGAPEQLRGETVDAASDCYALGALLFLLTTGTDPLLAPDELPGRATAARLADWLAAMAETSENVCRLWPLLRGLLADEPADRWTLPRARRFLDAVSGVPVAVSALSVDVRPDPDTAALLDGGIAHLLATMTPEDRERLWPATPYGKRSDACNVQHGAAGVLAVLTTLARDRGDERLADAVDVGAQWLGERLDEDRAAGRKMLPGLYFGRAGTAWALYEAAGLLDDPGLAARALELLDELPVDWPNPDITHGMAGAGLAALRLWRASGETGMRRRAYETAELLAARAERADGMILWPVPTSFDSRLAGVNDYGFAHGAAGVGAFLLAAGELLREPKWVKMADEVGRMLSAVAVPDDRGVRWRSGPADTVFLREFWCSGGSGIGTFLVRLARARGDSDYLALAERAAVAVWHRRWLAGPSVCHGLAGNGEFLLDLASAGAAENRSRAEDLATALAARAALRDGRLVATDDTMLGFGAEYGAGVAGWVAFLHRLRHGGARPWMVEAA
ncbi:class IV lanthionine synthetase LanL [Nocardia arthritidis]|uniref:non-specific serine/threonine protein kinase n=1 Tax=Nocardia arthritidis TaxID=228602 RepID=A0A6G9YPG7_9NOCA|nr:class IV lanthionine synthetase LanL [Nocardia arthritidis]QIS14977.1 protein kinase [Nocardia arthritidis]